MAYAVLLLFHGAASTVKASAQGACFALRPNPLSETLRGLAPDFELPDLFGQKVSLRNQRGRPLLISFFATWCPPCVEEMPSLELLARRLGDKAKVIVVSVDEDMEALKKFFQKGTATLLLHDKSQKVPKSFGTLKYPESFLLDPSGTIRYAFINQRDWSVPEAVSCVEGLKP
jgi:cytochrome c biogenesis protein CcmG, thiol:disulfide interchange protein DsbE